MNSQKRCDYDVDWYVLTYWADDELSVEKNNQIFLERADEFFFIVKST